MVRIYTDGSCHTESKTGGWAAILFIDHDKVTIKGIVQGAMHNRMELKAVVNAIDYLISRKIDQEITVYTDSQYVANLSDRKEKLKANQWLTKKGLPIRNVELVKKLIDQIEHCSIKFIKVTAHQKPGGTINYNREVDMLVRKMVRERVDRFIS